MSELLTVEELSEFLRVPVKTLYQWRTKKYGPQGKRIGRYIRYQRTKVLEWIESTEEYAL